jgi:hypothetical protein
LGDTEGAMRRIMQDQDVEELFAGNLAFVYKHSPT